MTVSYECKNNQWPGTLKHLEYNQTIRNYFGEKKLDIKDIVFICNIDKIPIITAYVSPSSYLTTAFLNP